MADECSPASVSDSDSVAAMNAADVRRALAEDADDLAAYADRVREPEVPFERMVGDLRRRGKL